MLLRATPVSGSAGNAQARDRGPRVRPRARAAARARRHCSYPARLGENDGEQVLRLQEEEESAPYFISHCVQESCDAEVE